MVPLTAVSLLTALAGGVGGLFASEPKFTDKLQRVRLTQTELSGEIGRRINDLIYSNYMVLNLDRDFLDPFRKRPFKRGYVGIGNVIDGGSMFTAYTGDPEVRERTKGLIEELMKTRDPDGYLGTIPAPAGRRALWGPTCADSRLDDGKIPAITEEETFGSKP
jgi:hypothetical protein